MKNEVDAMCLVAALSKAYRTNKKKTLLDCLNKHVSVKHATRYGESEKLRRGKASLDIFIFRWGKRV